MNKRLITASIVSAVTLLTVSEPSSARGIRADVSGGNWGSAYDPTTFAVPSWLPAGLLINPTSTSNPVSIGVIAVAIPPEVLAPIAGFQASVAIVGPDLYDYDAQTYPYYIANGIQGSTVCSNYASGSPVLPAPNYYACNNVPALNLEFGGTADEPSIQVIFYDLGPTPTTNFDTTLYDAFGNAVLSPPATTAEAWEIEFNCGGCASGASLVWNGTLYVAPATAPASEDILPSGSNVLTATSISVLNPLANPPAVQTISAPNQDGPLLNEFVFDGQTLHPPPGWTAITIAAPAGLTPAAGNASITLSWTPTAGATSYNVYQSTTAGGEGTTPVKTGITTGSTVIGGLASGQKYFFKVTAVYNGVESGASAEVSATVLPATPTGLTATTGAASMTLQWNAAAGATSYSIYEGSSAGKEAATPLVAGVTATTYTVSSLAAGHSYFFDIVAVNAGGDSAPSNEATGTVLAAVPVNLSATSGNGTVTLSWNASAGAASYDVYEGSAAGSEAATPVASSVTGTSTTISGLTNGATYYFKVAAVDAGGISAQSNEASATPAAPASSSGGGSGGGGAITPIDLLLGLTALGLARHRKRLRIAHA